MICGKRHTPEGSASRMKCHEPHGHEGLCRFKYPTPAVVAPMSDIVERATTWIKDSRVIGAELPGTGPLIQELRDELEAARAENAALVEALTSLDLLNALRKEIHTWGPLPTFRGKAAATVRAGRVMEIVRALAERTEP